MMKSGYFEKSTAFYILLIGANFIFIWGRTETFPLIFGTGLIFIGCAFNGLSEMVS